MEVAVISTSGNKVSIYTTGIWDGKTVDKMYVKINGQLYYKAMVVPIEIADQVVTQLKSLYKQKDLIDAEIYKIQSSAHI